MLEELIVSNLGLIPNASIEPDPGLTVITGETGAGKTVMLGALRLLVGEPAPKGIIGPHGDTTDVSARFFETRERVVRRVVTRSRSRAYLDGAACTATILREVIGPRIAIVGQHDQHTITSAAGVRRLLDNTFTEQDTELVLRYSEAWDIVSDVKAEAEMLGPDQRSLARERETLQFQISEIDEAAFAVGDEEELAAKASRLRNSEGLATAVASALDALGDGGAGAQIADAARALAGAAAIDASLDDLSSQIGDASTMVSDIATEVARYAADLDVDPVSLQETEERVALLSSLKRKYGESVDEILRFRKAALDRDAELSHLLDSAESISERMEQAGLALTSTGDALREARQKAARRVAVSAVKHLKELGFADPVVEIEVREASPARYGSDVATVVFASDNALPTGPIATIASGGELSRLVLALTLASGGADSDIVAFDEIDSGIGGTTALAMGRKLATLAETRQVICVTHLPQVAAFADKHYVVARSGTAATIVETEGDSRIEELARMLAGLQSSKKGREHAEELLALAADSSAT